MTTLMEKIQHASALKHKYKQELQEKKLEPLRMMSVGTTTTYRMTLRQGKPVDTKICNETKFTIVYLYTSEGPTPQPLTRSGRRATTNTRTR
jgi:hypothetical protein